MTTGTPAVRITAILHANLSEPVAAALQDAGLHDYHAAAGRWVTLKESRRALPLGGPASLAAQPVSMLSLLVVPPLEAKAVGVIVEHGGLTLPGRGTIFTEDVVVHRSHPLCEPIATGAADQPGDLSPRALAGICCIVQKGTGDKVARVALDTGTCVPAITFGFGTGVRDKLGLLRITVPADKELVTLVTSAYDAEAILHLLVTVGQLNQPGKGFVYQYPVRHGLVNVKVMQGMARHAASIEQIIMAIDELRGETSWRARTGSMGSDAPEPHDYLTDLVNLVFTCDEGRGEDLVKVAMASASLPGATISRARHVRPDGSDRSSVSAAREQCSMVIAERLVEPIVGAMVAHGALDDETHGQFCVSAVPRAFTYVPPKKS